MAEDRYRLAPLREVRERSEVTHRGNLSTAISDARVTEAAVAEAAARVERARLALDAAGMAGMAGVSGASATYPASPAGSTATQLVVAERYRSRLRAALAAARDEELRARLVDDARSGEVETARARLARARADREVIERHFATWRETQRKRRENRD